MSDALTTEPGRTLTESLVAQLRRTIADGVLVPGEKLPSETALIEQFRVSRTVVREAVSRLAAAGLVETLRGRGSYVLMVPNDEGFQAPVGPVRSLAERLELLAFRRGCEAEAAALAAVHATPEQIQRIAEALDAFRMAGDNPRDAAETDYRFHLAVATASGNRHFRDLIASLGPTMIAMPRFRLEATGEDGSHVSALEHACREHEAVLGAIRRGDALAASAAMRTHLSESGERLARGIIRD